MKNEKLKKEFEKSFEKFEKFFGFNWTKNKPKLFMVENREMIDELQGHKTEDWVVGWSNGTRIYLLKPENYEKESCHKYSEKTYLQLMKHELVHSFLKAFLKNKDLKPNWLEEGLAGYLSEQHTTNTPIKKYESFLKYYSDGGPEIYRESAKATEYLIEKYGKEKILEIIKKSVDCKDEKEFEKLFKKIYNFDLKYENFKIL